MAPGLLFFCMPDELGLKKPKMAQTKVLVGLTTMTYTLDASESVRVMPGVLS